MRVAVKNDGVVISKAGRIKGHDAGPTLVRRFLRIFPGSLVIGPTARRCKGFDVVPVSYLDPENTVIINPVPHVRKLKTHRDGGAGTGST
mgnify:CR=1 FL=1